MEIYPKNPNEETKTNKKKNKKPVKVVYIANPLKVKTSATEFRALVQELTGRDSDPSKYIAVQDTESYIDQAEEIIKPVINEAHTSSSMETVSKTDESSFEMIDNFQVFSPPLMLYDPLEYCISGFDYKD